MSTKGVMSLNELAGPHASAAVTAVHASILIVDDYPSNLFALEAILAPLGHRLVAASSGEEALKRLLQEEFAVILMDVQMPGMDGFVTAQMIRDRPKTRHTPIIFITAIHREPGHAHRGYSLGAVDYLLKPFDPDVLRSKVSVFVELYLKNVEIQRQAELIRQRDRELFEQRLEHRFHSFTDLMPLGLLAARADGRVYYCNEHWLRYTGLTLEDSVDISALSIIHPDDISQVREGWAQAAPRKVPFEMEARLRRNSDGAYRWHLSRSVPEYDEHGQHLGWVITAMDIHDQKQMEEARERLLVAERHARETAESASRAKDEFLATVSHELRTPLNAILGWARMLRSGMLDAGKINQALATIERNAEVQTELIEDMLDVSRIITGKMRIQIRKVSARAIIHAAVDTVRPAVEAKNIKLALELADDVDELSADADRFQQIVWNLLSNAVKFTPDHGNVTLRASKVGEQIQIKVIDSGRGIGKEFLPHVFDQFRQAEGVSTRTHGGLGLGLAIVRHLVELHGGTVTAYSEGEDTGATFSVTLPQRLVAEDDAEPAWLNGRSDSADVESEEDVRLDGIRILFVDDQQDAREMLSELLQIYGASVTAVDSAKAAYEALEHERFDVLVSDIGLPHENGYDLIRKVRSYPTERGGKIPAIAVTGFARAEDGRRALAEGFQNHLAKPVEPGELVSLIACLSGGRVAAASAKLPAA